MRAQAWVHGAKAPTCKGRSWLDEPGTTLTGSGPFDALSQAEGLG